MTNFLVRCITGLLHPLHLYDCNGLLTEPSMTVMIYENHPTVYDVCIFMYRKRPLPGLALSGLFTFLKLSFHMFVYITVCKGRMLADGHLVVTHFYYTISHVVVYSMHPKCRGLHNELLYTLL